MLTQKCAYHFFIEFVFGIVEKMCVNPFLSNFFALVWFQLLTETVLCRKCHYVAVFIYSHFLLLIILIYCIQLFLWWFLFWIELLVLWIALMRPKYPIACVSKMECHCLSQKLSNNIRSNWIKSIEFISWIKSTILKLNKFCLLRILFTSDF